MNIICKIFGHKKLYNQDWRASDKDMTYRTVWWCKRCGKEENEKYNEK